MPFTARENVLVFERWRNGVKLTFGIIEIPKRLDELRFLRWTLASLWLHRLSVDSTQPCCRCDLGLPLVRESSERSPLS